MSRHGSFLASAEALRPCLNTAVRHPHVSQCVSEATSDTIACALRRAASVQGPPSGSTGVPGNRSLKLVSEIRLDTNSRRFPGAQVGSLKAVSCG
jgi:hypothetical protein